MLTTASQFGPRARSLRANHAATAATAHRILGASAVVTLRQCQQARDFRFGSWFSHIDSEVQEEVKRHQRAFKQKYADQLSRRLNWDKHPLTDDARHAVKRMMASYWLSHEARPCGRHDNASAAKQRTADNKDGVRPGQNIEDVERGAMEHLMFGKGQDGATRGQNLKRKRGKKNKHNSVHHTSNETPEPDDYFIDPVTNRKVAKHSAPKSPDGGVDIRVKTFRDDRTRCDAKDGIQSVFTNTEYTGGAPGSAGKSSSTSHSDAQAESHAPPKGNYRYSPAGTPNAQMSYKASSAPVYDNLLDYVTRNMPAKARGLGLKHYDLHKYKPVVVDAQDSSERTQQLDSNLENSKPVADKEPVQFEDLKPPYEDLQKYNSAVVDEIVARFESDKPVDPEGKEDAETENDDLDSTRSESSVDTSIKWTEDSPIHEDVNRYRLSKHDEPHGKPLGYQIFGGIGGFQNLEPGDFPALTVEQLREKYGTSELRKYTAVRHVGTEGNSSTAEEQAVEYLKKRYDPEELAKYTPVYWNEPDGQPLAAEDSRVAEGLTKEYDPAELADYKPVYWNEPDGKPLSPMDEGAAGELTEDQATVEIHDSEQPVQWNAPDGLPPTAAEKPGMEYTDLDQYEPIMYQEPDGHLPGPRDSTKEGLEEMDAVRDYENGDRLASEGLDRADEPSAEVPRRLRKSQEAIGEFKESERRQMLEQQMNRYQTASDATDHEASLAIKFARARAANAESERQLTGNYARDFPEEFDKSWTETLSKTSPETAQPNDDFMFETQSMDGGLEGAFGRPSPARIQPALDRHLEDQPHMTKTSQTVDNQDSGSSATQELDTTHGDEPIDTPTSSAFTKHHGDVPAASADQKREASSPETVHQDATNEPTLYKILAYDPTMQKIEVAETSSFVPDTASALTPADALLRLSHPTRFFPHFAPLQAEGYEIISGTGDVLVFRKVRPETSRDKPAGKPLAPDQPATTAGESGAVETRINPIDMTGRPRFSPASANFASPTGYVNYDNIPETAGSKLPPPPPKIKYNIDVHREEPVFSGPKARSSDGHRGKKKSLGKRLVVGGVWVAGLSYALGVITEFFTTGGIDGTGPNGL